MFILKDKELTMRHVSHALKVAFAWLFGKINLNPKIKKSNTLISKSNSSLFWRKTVSHVMNGNIFTICSISWLIRCFVDHHLKYKITILRTCRRIKMQEGKIRRSGWVCHCKTELSTKCSLQDSLSISNSTEFKLIVNYSSLDSFDTGHNVLMDLTKDLISSFKSDTQIRIRTIARDICHEIENGTNWYKIIRSRFGHIFKNRKMFEKAYSYVRR